MNNKLYISFVWLVLFLTSCKTNDQKDVFQSLTSDPSISQIIYNINIIDITNGDILPNKTIFIKSKSIFRITDTFLIEEEVDAVKLVDGTSKYIIPGLWDMHVHTRGEGSFTELEIPRYIAHGITGIREMSGAPMDLAWKDSIKQGTLIGPKMHVGQFVNGYSVYANSFYELLLSDTNQVDTAIDSLHSLGYDFIKTYDNLKEDVYKAILQKAAVLDFEVSGHVPLTVRTEDAIEGGQKTLEHSMGIELSSSPKGDSLRNGYRNLLNEIDSSTTMQEEIAIFTRSEVDAIASIDLEKRDALFQLLKRKNTWIVPTYIYQYLVSYPTANTIVNSPEMQYLGKGHIDFSEDQEMWSPNGELEETINYRLSYLKEMYDAGVGILAGSDSPFGFFLHHELFLFVEHGLTPLQALQTATINPAKYLNMTDSLGTVDEGKIADLVILNSNPLIDIHNINDIDAVSLNGKLFNRARLDIMLSDVKNVINELGQ